MIESVREAFPDFANQPRWVGWEYREVKGRQTKVPLCRSGLAKTDDPQTWTTLDAASQINGNVGIILTDGLSGVDLDACITIDGEVEDWAAEILDRFNTYAEISPSGRGLKLFFETDAGVAGKSVQWGDPVPEIGKRREIAVFGSGRYFTVTGRSFGDRSMAYVPSEKVDWLYGQIESRRKTKAAAKPSGLQKALQGPPSGDLSANFYRLIAWCKTEGMSETEALQAIQSHPQHIPDRYRHRLHDEVERVYKKADEPSQSDEAIEDELLESILPAWDETAEFGILHQMVTAATERSEATRAGVWLSVLGHLTMLARPFCVRFGDELAGSNLMMLLVGPSALGRKGTSMAFANTLMSHVRDTFAGVIESVDRQSDDALKSQEIAQAASRRLEMFKEKLRMINDIESVEALRAQLVDLGSTLQVREASLKEAEIKRDEAFGTRGYDMRQKSITKACAEILPMREQAKQLQQQIKFAEEYQANPGSVRADIESELAVCHQDLAVAMAGAKETPDTPPWLPAIRVLAEEPQTVTGVSTPVGLMDRIADDFEQVDTEGNTVVIPGNPDKRVLVDLSEFGALISIMRTSMGAGLSELFRNVYDAKPYTNGAKVHKTNVAEHQISVLGNCTPKELIGLLFDSRDRAATSSNGFANRFVYLFSRSERSIPDPLPTEGVEEFAQVIVQNVLSVYQKAGITSQANRQFEMKLTPEAALYWGTEDHPGEYQRMRNHRSKTVRADDLTGRMVTNTRKLSCVMSLINGESEVSLGSLKAAAAAIWYSARVIDTICGSVGERVEANKVRDNAMRIVAQLSNAESKTLALRDLYRAAHLKASQAKTAIDWLQDFAPPVIELRKNPTRVQLLRTFTESTN